MTTPVVKTVYLQILCLLFSNLIDDDPDFFCFLSPSPARSFVSGPPGNGTMPPFANNNSGNAASGGGRDATFGNMGRANGRSPGNGAPPVTAGAPPTSGKSSVTISNGRDPRRAKRWMRALWEIYPVPPPAPLTCPSPHPTRYSPSVCHVGSQSWNPWQPCAFLQTFRRRFTERSWTLTLIMRCGFSLGSVVRLCFSTLQFVCVSAVKLKSALSPAHPSHCFQSGRFKAFLRAVSRQRRQKRGHTSSPCSHSIYHYFFFFKIVDQVKVLVFVPPEMLCSLGPF